MLGVHFKGKSQMFFFSVPTMASNIVVKILLDYEVYEKLKRYEKEIEQLHSKFKQQLEIVPDSNQVLHL